MMAIDEEQYVLDTLKQIEKETHENNIMLKGIINYINKVLSNQSNASDQEFIRNLVANIMSEMVDEIRL